MTSTIPSVRSASAGAENTLLKCDALVIGGGPAGSTISTLLADGGWRVVLLEKDRHPRFHIGESLLPMNLPILKRLGVLEQVQQIGMVKPGIEMYSDHPSGKAQTFYFDKLPESMYPHAFEVRRSEFDHLLLKNSAARGVEVHEGVRVTDVRFRSGLTKLVCAKDETDRWRTWETRIVIDASGRNTFLSTRLGLKRKNDRHNSAAIFGHFENAARRPGRDEGNIGLYWFKHGWFWMIPLRDNVMSVGAVCWPDYLKTRRNNLDDFLWETIRLCPGVHERMKQAQLIAPASATGNYSYSSTRMWGDGYVLVGDAYAFVDPLFSSGVYLAMNSASLGAEVVDACLREGRPLAPLLDEFEGQVRRGLRTLSWFIYRFTTPAIRNLFMSPRNFLRMEQAVLSVLAGDVFRRNRWVVPIALFKILYYLTVASNSNRSWASFRRRKRNVEMNFAEH